MGKLTCPIQHRNNGAGAFCSECGRRNVDNNDTKVVFWGAFNYSGFGGQWVEIFDTRFSDHITVIRHIEAGTKGHYYVSPDNVLAIMQIMVWRRHYIVLNCYDTRCNPRTNMLELGSSISCHPKEIELYQISTPDFG
ncbi:MAG: hypothetical protein PVI21_02240 [Candidatus Woesebacteria bacterium]|jgi:hypothetical protein